MIVIAQRMPIAMWNIAISHHPVTIQRMLKTSGRQPLSVISWTSRPKGQSATPAILNNCTPKGMPMMVRHIRRPKSA